ncbi:hypothetical protein BU25DRAFT_471753 [Macroventuria anomochaeta]|uniref:Uncharacterized protein n=1 Tax=Macroventuria anomochaeta TaxID=301207 RepID=A0ACB6RXV2_9PLEO|nr:uncharacterized protein BU25DRAFT_471753 [Macroventuria anomochaeta]KAF2626741.1 hypothetical protein BU25DRAFT_471753 [Macroventuria anomochaeta]
MVMNEVKSPQTPEKDDTLKCPDTKEGAHYFWNVDHRQKGETMEDVALQHGISARIGERWRHERNHFGDARRVRKDKAREKRTKLGRPFTVPLNKIQALIDDEKAPLNVQAQQISVNLQPRSLQYNLSNRENAQNKTSRVQYGDFHEHYSIFDYWHAVWFTDKAHFNPTERLQRTGILRRFKMHDCPFDLPKKKQKKKSKLTLHMMERSTRTTVTALTRHCTGTEPEHQSESARSREGFGGQNQVKDVGLELNGCSNKS